jgi:hypothetical protein
MSKASKSAPGFNAPSQPNQDASASAVGKPGFVAPDLGNSVPAIDCDLLLLPFLDTKLDAHGSGSETRASGYKVVTCRDPWTGWIAKYC